MAKVRAMRKAVFLIVGQPGSRFAESGQKKIACKNSVGKKNILRGVRCPLFLFRLPVLTGTELFFLELSSTLRFCAN
jgi:hypothetical protein